MSLAWDKGSTRAWRAVRAFVLERDNHRCQLKLKFCQVTANTVNHKLAKSQGGTDHPSNLEAACGWCNSSLGAAVSDPEPLGRW